MTFPVFGAPRRPVNRLYFFNGPFHQRAGVSRRQSRNIVNQGEPNMRFQPGQSGNPAGRPRGSRNRSTIMVEKLLNDSAGELTTAAIELATKGDPAAQRACLDRLIPRLRHRPLDFALPDLVTLADTPVAINAIAQGLARGDLDLEEAAALMRAVRFHAGARRGRALARRRARRADHRRRGERREPRRLPGGAHPMSRS
jgi:hypothetical protein